jgi:ABC-2 type transport system permease protein
MKRFLLLTITYTRRSFLEMMAWRSFLFTLVINQAVTPLLGLAVWSAALPGQAGISSYFAALLVVQLLTVSYEYHTISMAIYEGHLNDWLLRPHQVVISAVGENTATRIWHFVIGLPIVAAIAIFTDVSLDAGNVLAAIPALVIAGILRFLFTYALSLSALWGQQAGGVTELGSTLIFLLGGMAVPISLFPERFQPLGEALPFRAMLGFPAEIASGQLTAQQIVTGYGWQVLWLAMLVPLTARTWSAGVRRYTALGG